MKFRSVVFAATLVLTAGVAQAVAQTRIITGRVTDSLSNEIVTSGQISVQGTTIGATINDDGTFTLAVPARDVSLTVRSIGFKRQNVQVASSQNSVQVALGRDFFQLEAIVVTGQATGVERRNLANAVATVSAQQLSEVSAVSLDQALQGKLLGANILKNSGAPGGGALVQLRGVTSINGAFTPLYVIDGVIASDVALPRSSNFISQASRGFTVAVEGENAVNRISDLNPSDIENVEVLKGAAASAIYGSKASNGVILITTKRGRVGAPQFTITQRFGTISVLNRIGLRRFQSEADAVATYGAIAASSSPDGWGASKFFDNEEALISARPLNYETGASISGGTETTRYFATGLVRHEGGLIAKTYADKRSVRLNLDQDIGERLTIQLNTNVVNTTGDKGLTINENNNSSLWAALSNTPSFYDLRAICPDGSREVSLSCEGGAYPVNPFVASNPLHTANNLENRERVWRIITSARAELDIVNTPQHSLRFIGVGGTDFFNQHNTVFSPPDLQFEAVDGLFGSSAVGRSNNLNLNVNANAVYKYTLANATSFTTQFGLQYETRELEIDRVVAANLVGGIQSITAGTTILVDARHEYVKDFGFFAQEEFLGLGEKLLLTLGVRADQSSNNGDTEKLYWYPKASASYRIPQLVPGTIDELKFRAAVGQSGNQPLYGAKFTELVGGNVGGVPSGQIASNKNAADIVPERQLEIEGGIDATLFGGRANLEATWYQKRITDLLLQRTLPPSFGFSAEFLNGGVLRTRGVEIGLRAIPVQRADFQWSVGGSWHSYRCVMTELPVPGFGGGGFGGGSPRVAADSSCTQIGGFDSLSDGTRVSAIIGETRPDFNLQFSNEIRYKALRLNTVIDHQTGGKISNLTGWLYDLNGNSKDYDDPSPVSGMTLGQWRPVVFRKNPTPYVQDMTFTKLRELSLAVELPRSFVQNLWSGARYIRLTASGRNLIMITDYRGTDPESRWRPERSLSRSVPRELWAYPPSRQFWFSIDLGF